MRMCHDPTCLLTEAPGSRYCAVHTVAVLASTVKADGVCWRCGCTIRRDDLVSRTKRQTKHKTTGETRFQWQHHLCQAPARQPGKAARRKAVKPLFADILLEVE